MRLSETQSLSDLPKVTLVVAGEGCQGPNPSGHSLSHTTHHSRDLK